VIEGRVVRETPSGTVPVAGLELRLRRQGTEEQRSLTSFSDGAFYLMGVKPGEYELTVDPGDLERLGLAADPLAFSLAADADGAAVDGLELRLR
jgi:hypothetical protein